MLFLFSESSNISKVPVNFKLTIISLLENGADPCIANFSGSSVITLLPEFNIPELPKIISDKLAIPPSVEPTLLIASAKKSEPTKRNKRGIQILENITVTDVSKMLPVIKKPKIVPPKCIINKSIND